MEAFPLTPDYTFTETPKFNTLISTFENGKEQRRSKWPTPLREFKTTFKNRPKEDYGAVVAFFISMLGSFTAFTFTNPNDDTVYTVRFKEDEQPTNLGSGNVYTFEVPLVEVK